MRWLLYTLATLAGLIVLAVVVLLLLGLRGTEMEASTEIAAPPQAVYAWLVEPARLTQWVAWLIEVCDESPGRTGVGQRTRWRMDDPNLKQIVDIESEVIEWEPGRRLTVRIASPAGFHGRVRYDLDDLDGTTRLRQHADYALEHWLARLLSPVVMHQARTKLRDDLARLKMLVEAERSR